MRTGFALCGLVLCLFSAGCSLVESATHLATYKAAECLDDCSEKHRNRQWAEAAWERHRNDTFDCRYPQDYAEGFKEGFADFLYEGGDGEPPALPPKKYRAMRYQTPQGYLAIEDWFAGFRNGAAEARQGGYRKWITGPSSLQSETPVPQQVQAQVRREPPPPETARPKDDQAQVRREPSPPETARPKDDQAQVRREPPPPEMVGPKDESQDAAPARPPAPVDVQAEFLREQNAWQIVWNVPDGGGVRSTRMSPAPFTDLIKTVVRHKQENKDVGGRHGLTIDNGTNRAATEVDSATFEDLAAFLAWYYEEPAE